MFRNSVQLTAAIVCDAARTAVPVPAIGDWHDAAGHHRYYGSSSFNGGERIVESRQRSMFLEFSRDNNGNR
ncbi:MAG TPA: hypothetical protein VN838_00410 [Bradyrhizobium sp.]|nr:hypothetical protein [Bradyrhizobium sp.]